MAMEPGVYAARNIVIMRDVHTASSTPGAGLPRFFHMHGREDAGASLPTPLMCPRTICADPAAVPLGSCTKQRALITFSRCMRLCRWGYAGEVKTTVVFCVLDSLKDLVIGLPWGERF